MTPSSNLLRKWFIHVPEEGEPSPSLGARALNYLIALSLIAALFSFSFQQVSYNWNWNSVWVHRYGFIQGWLVTIFISLASLALSTLMGVVFALAQRSPFLPLRYLGRVYVEIVRGTPLLVQILILFYVVFTALRITNRFVDGIIILSIFSGAYITEMIRAGIEGVGQSQLESARAIGLTRAQIYRYVIFPQALRQTLPPLTGQFVSLIKDSSLLSVMSIGEFAYKAREINSLTTSTFESYLPLALGYLVLTLPISLWTRHLEKKFRYET